MQKNSSYLEKVPTRLLMLNLNLYSENCWRKIQSDRLKKWSKIAIVSPITFWENSRSWSWSDLRSLFEQVILMWSKIAKKVIGHYFDLILKDINCMPVPGIPTLFWTREKIFFIFEMVDIYNKCNWFPIKNVHRIF